MKKKLDYSSLLPLYHQLKEIIRENIESGIWNHGDMIPSEHNLMKEYDVSRNTIKKALEDLVQEGLLNRIQGKGTFVSMPKIEQSLSSFYSFSKVMKESGYTPNDIILSIEFFPVKQSVAKVLKLSEGDEVWVLRRLRCIQDEPMMLETSYIPRKLVHKITKEELEQMSLYELMLKNYGIIVKKAKEIFEPVLIRDYESRYLKVDKGYPALLLDRIAFDANDVPIEFCRSIVRGDRCRFYTELL